MITVLVTGASGFIGKNLVQELSTRPEVSVLGFDLGDDQATLKAHLRAANVVIHLAGVNRPDNAEDYQTGNVSLTEYIVSTILAGNNRPVLAISSSVQVAVDNPYGRSKLQAERIVESYGNAGGAAVIYRLPNVFGKWSRPDYNSVVATFCYNIARDLPITVSDPKRLVELVYIDDVVRAFGELVRYGSHAGVKVVPVSPTTTISLGTLVSELRQMSLLRTQLLLPDMGDYFRRCLYATYVSFLPEDAFEYSLRKHQDARGELAELIKAPSFGQLFISRTRPGIERGNHFHNTKVEKFCVVEGEALIRLRHILREDILVYSVKGEDFRILDIPPGYTHSIENVGKRDMVVLFWSNELYDSSKPDTYANAVRAHESKGLL